MIPKKSLTKVNNFLQNLGAELLPDSETHDLRIQIKSASSNRKYIVSKRKTKIKQWECSCPGWVMHYPRKPCKHLKEMIPILEQVQKILSPAKKAIKEK